MTLLRRATTTARILFFFQAEDGIRDRTVTGVQTCALPIWFAKRLSQEIEKRGTLDVLRKGIKDSGIQVDLAYFRPATGLNPDVQSLYEGNIFTVVRQLRYSAKNDNSIDTVLFLNGLP